MAYPFTSWPRLAQFVEKALAAGAKEEAIRVGVVGPRGPTAFRVLILDGRSAVLPDDDGHPLSPTVLRSLCNRLNIPISEFGFTIGDWDTNGPDPS